MKRCSKCGKTKTVQEFPCDAQSPDGLRCYCKDCAYEMTRKWNRSFKGVAIRMWHKHVNRSIERGHGKPGYTRQWLLDYILEHPDYPKLHAEYVASGYDKYKSPSIDRLDDNVGYRKDNIRLVSFQDNMDHCYDAGRKAEYLNAGWESGCMSNHKAVVQLHLNGEFKEEFISVNDAARSVEGASNSKIPMCCKGKRFTHAGYQWVYAEDYYNPDYNHVDRSGKAVHPQSIPVLKLDFDGNIIARYESASQAARCEGFTQTGISKCVAGKIKTYKGFYWKADK